MSSEIDQVANVSKDGTAEKFFSIIAFVVWIALHGFTLLPISCKSAMSGTEPEPPYEIPYFVGISVSLHQWFSFVNSVTVMDYTFHYICLSLSNFIALIPTNLYTLFFLRTQQKRVVPAVWVISHNLCLSFYLILVTCLCESIPTMRVVSGIPNIVSGIVMYATPLPLVIKSRKLEDVQFILALLCVAYFFNGLAWSIVALSASYFDPYILIIHGVGTILGLVHLGIILNSTWFPKIWITLKDRMSSIDLGFSTKIHNTEDLV